MATYPIQNALYSIREAARAFDSADELVARIDAVEQECSYENLSSAMNAARMWKPLLADAGLGPAFRTLEEHDPVFVSVMPEYLLNDDGTLRPIPHFMKTPDGATRLHSAGNAVLYHDVKASVFRHPIVSENLYDGAEALAAGSTKDLEPVGVGADYMISILDGELRIPDLHPGEAMALAHAREIAEAEARTEESVGPDF
jgi:hypothetical protein